MNLPEKIRCEKCEKDVPPETLNCPECEGYRFEVRYENMPDTEQLTPDQRIEIESSTPFPVSTGEALAGGVFLAGILIILLFEGTGVLILGGALIAWSGLNLLLWMLEMYKTRYGKGQLYLEDKELYPGYSGRALVVYPGHIQVAKDERPYARLQCWKKSGRNTDELYRLKIPLTPVRDADKSEEDRNSTPLIFPIYIRDGDLPSVGEDEERLWRLYTWVPVARKVYTDNFFLHVETRENGGS